MASTTKSRLARATVDYDKATARLSFFVPSNASAAKKVDATVPILRQDGARRAVPTHDTDADTSMRGGNSAEAWDAMAQAAYGAGRFLEQCITDHRFGQRRTTHKCYTAGGRTVWVSRATLKASGHDFPEANPWLP